MSEASNVEEQLLELRAENESLRREALMKYGTEVGAVINVDYMTNPKNDVSATGLAVRFKGE